MHGYNTSRPEAEHHHLNIGEESSIQLMSYRTNSDNIYEEGAFVAAKENPSLKLKIMKYYQRIYYCVIVGDEDRKQLAYFERELISPRKPDEQRISVNL